MGLKMDEFCYKYRCCYIFEESFGKYGCPFCYGNPPARLVKMTPAKEKILSERKENERVWIVD